MSFAPFKEISEFVDNQKFMMMKSLKIFQKNNFSDKILLKNFINTKY